MIDSSKIDLFEKYLSATDYAFGSDNKPAQVSDEDKLIYQEGSMHPFAFVDLVSIKGNLPTSKI